MHRLVYNTFRTDADRQTECDKLQLLNVVEIVNDIIKITVNYNVKNAANVKFSY